MFSRKNSGALVLLVFLLTLSWAVGAGAESYTLIREISTGSFGTLDSPNDVSVGPDGKIFIADTGNTRVLVLDQYQNVVHNLTLPGQLLPSGVSATGNGSLLFVANLLDNIVKVSTSDWSSENWGMTGSDPGQFALPASVAAAADGNVYVADSGNNRVQKFAADGTFLKSWGQAGSGNGEFQNPQSIAVDSSINAVLVADTDNSRVQIFDTSGNFIFAAGPATGVSLFPEPSGLAFGPDSIYVADAFNGNVQKFGYDGTYSEIGLGDLFLPHGIAVDKGGNVYVADTGNSRVAVFSPDVVVLDRGRGESNWTRPSGIAVVIDLEPDSYWNNAPVEIYSWVEAYGFIVAYQGADQLTLLNSLSELTPTDIPPLATGSPVGPVRNIVPVLVSSTAGWPSATFTFNVCLDRELNGRYDPSASTCGKVDINLL